MQAQVVQKCNQCEGDIIPENDGGAGYAIDDAGNLVCYKCCAVEDKERMREHGRIALYLTFNGAKWIVSNWPGTLKLSVQRFKEGDHNMTGFRRDVWFDFEGYQWHGVQYGRNSEVCYCRKTKNKSTN